MSTSIKDNITQVKKRINAAEKKAGRTTGIVQLIAVSKTRTANEVRKTYHAGITCFGENYLQEALAKQQSLSDLNISWHFIGPIQSNKTADIANNFAWVHSLDRIKIANRLNEQRNPNTKPLNVCIQINISNESSKSGIAIEELDDFAAVIEQLPQLKLRGLMAIPSPSLSALQLKLEYHRLYEAMIHLRHSGIDCDTLSMGMSNDLECAIAEGATMVRVGTAIFGPRKNNNSRDTHD